MRWSRAGAVVLAVLAVGMATAVSGAMAEGSPPATPAVAIEPPAASSTSATSAVATSARRLALGLSVRDYSDVGRLDELTTQFGGQAPAIWSVWSDWGGRNPTFPVDLVQRLRLRGVTPLIFWQPVNPGDLNGGAYTYRRILSGTYDAYIRAWATAAKASRSTILLRFAHEMDGIWFPWGMSHYDNTPARFVKAWRHIWNIFRGPGGVGATNVKFVWSPMWPKLVLYPGNSYVDYVGFTSFNWGRGHGPWTSMLAGLAPKVTAALRFTHKPFIVCEIGTTPIGGNKVTWIRNGYRAVYTRLPHVAAIVYFDIDMRPGQPDWRMESAPGALDAYAAIVARTAYQGGIPGKPAAAISLPTATKSTHVPLTWTVGDPSRVGIAGYFVSTSPVKPGPASPGWTSTKPAAVALRGPDGATTVYAWVKDTKGSISARSAATTVYDTEAPTASLHAPDVSPTRTIAVEVTGSDAGGSGIAGYRVSTDPTTPELGDFQAASPAALTLEGSNGRRTVYAWTVDAAGNRSAAASVTVDLEISPSMSLQLPAVTRRRDVPVEISVTDPGGTGIAGYEISERPYPPGSDDWSAGPVPARTSLSLSGGDGTHTLYGWVRDSNGNLSAAAQATTLLDTMPPAVSLAIDCSACASRTIDVTVIGDDGSGSGVVAFFLAQDSTTPAPDDPNWLQVAPTRFTISGDGEQADLYAWTMDAAGNISAPDHASVSFEP